MINSLIIKAIAILSLFAVLSYFVWDYKTTKENYSQLIKDYDKTVQAYEHSIKIIEEKTRENAIVEEKAKTVENAIKRLNKLKEGQNENIIDDTIINFSF